MSDKKDKKRGGTVPRSKIADSIRSDKQRAFDLQKAIVLKIRALMLKKELNQTDLSEITGIKQANISRKFSGKTILTLEDVVKFAKVFQVNPYELLKEKAPD